MPEETKEGGNRGRGGQPMYQQKGKGAAAAGGEQPMMQAGPQN